MTQHDYAARFQSLLAELFMLEQADLDFGIYRVMNARRKEIDSFLDDDLLPQIHEELQKNQIGNRTQLERDLAEAIQQARDLGVSQPDETPKARELRDKLSSTINIPQAEASVFNHLYNFFSRYYQGGDFLSLRRYKRDVYALPYEGEEVKLHWANADQYYIKTGEYFRDYTFTLGDGRRVHFKLAAADTEQNNNKANGDRERRFMLASAVDFLRVEDGELIINFAYQPDAAKRKQADINRETVARIFAALGASSGESVPVSAKPKAKKRVGKKGKAAETSNDAGDSEAEIALEGGGAAETNLPPALSRMDALSASNAPNPGVTALLAWAKALTQAMGTNGNPERTVLEKRLNDYTARNTFDYFIHKDLNGFLRRELDFYIKNEVMLLDDIERESAPRVENYLAIIRAIRRVGLKIIEFLAQLEDFQKSLWLKKKFVVETHWCVTLDRVTPEFYAEIAANERQRAEWVRLFAIDEINGDLHDAGYSEPLTVGFLEAQPHLVLDTSCFDRDFTERLLATDAFQDLDEQTDGVLIESENFQALNLLQARYRKQIKCVHIDPPYNTDTSGFLYKNEYKHSSWLSMMENRIGLSLHLLSDGGSHLCHIDENEYEHLRFLLDTFSIPDAGTIIWDKRNPMLGRKGVATQHEYITWRSYNEDSIYLNIANSKLIADTAQSLIALHGGVNNKSRQEFSRWITNQEDLSGGEKAYRFLEDDGSVYRGVAMGAPEQRTDPKFFIPLIHPTTKKPCPVPTVGWSRTPENLQELIKRGEILFGKDETTLPQKKVYLNEDSQRQISSVLQNAKRGKADVVALGLEFPYCHPVSLYETLLGAALSEENPLVLDFFAGSGTTAHAVINLNRDDATKDEEERSKRKFILVEMGEYFHTVTKPRVLKVIYSKDWRDGKPVSRQGSSCLVKILRLESYEDTLNNLRVHRTAQQQDLLAAHDSFREDYTLRYLFGRETAGSPSLLNLDLFENPFDYRLDIGERGSSAARVSTPVDLIETFNYLLGLRVTRRRTLEGFRIVEGATLDGTRTLIIWRNTREQDNDALNRFFLAQDFGAQGFQVIYSNGDHTLGMTRREGETWQPLMIEVDFKRLMFEGQG
jgi:adenine-specific DNA-methyltransferase